ncbi:chitin deacetylase [Phlyctochytrium planicorne]|nr:chitin deacetylase [Phlyctochytrium planicorne]
MQLKWCLLGALVSSAFAQNYDFSWTPSGVDLPGDPALTNTLLNGINYNDFDSDVLQCTNNVWGLTYDDGPTQYSNRVLDLLDQTGVKATFFVIGVNVKSNPAPLIRAYQAGHEIAIHTWGHKTLTELSTDQVIQQVVYGARIIRQLIGVTPRFIRAPTGAMNNQIRAALKKLGMRIIYWKRDTEDWNLAASVATNAIRTSFQNWVNAGDKRSVSLQHDAFDITTNAAPAALQVLLDAGLPIGKMSDCLGEPAYGGVLESYFAGNLAPVKPLEPTPPPPQPSPSPAPAPAPSLKSSLATPPAPVTTIAPVSTIAPGLTSVTASTLATQGFDEVTVTANTQLPISQGKGELGETIKAAPTSASQLKDLKASFSQRVSKIRIVDFFWGLFVGLFFLF